MMRTATFAVLALLLSAGAVVIPLRHAAGQDAPLPKTESAPPADSAAAPAAQTAAPGAEPGAAASAPQGAPAAATAPGAAAPPSAVTHRNVNLRGGPGTNYALLRLIRSGSSVDVKECKNGWCEVVFQGADGYIIESSIAANPAGSAAKPRLMPLSGYRGPPPAYNMRWPRYYPPPAYRYSYYPYYVPYWGWRRAYRRWW